MGRIKTWFAGALALVTAGAAWASGSWLTVAERQQQRADEKPEVSVSLVAEKVGLEPQAKNRLAVVFEHKNGWHTYWRMPGETGLATVFKATTQPDLKLTPLRFPVPERFETQGLVSFGYSEQTVFPFEVIVPRFPKTRPAVVRVNVRYLACKTSCVPEEKTLTLKLHYAVAPKPSKHAELIRSAQNRIPERSSLPGLGALYDGERLQISIPKGGAHIGKTLDFYPLTENTLNLNAPTRFVMRKDGSGTLNLTLEEEFAQKPAASLRGLLIADRGPTHGGWAVEADIPLAKGTLREDRATGFGSELPMPAYTAERLSTSAAFFFALLGGLILNLMPCVFPILSLKILHLVEGYRRGERLLPHGMAFTAGVLLSMAALSGTLIALRGVGTLLGWGFQLQTPWVVAVLLILFVAITFNLFGVFEFTAASHLADSRAAKKTPRTGIAGSFFTGVLTVIVASPCTAPFMGAALGYALLQPASEALAIFLMLGTGMALPWLLLCIFPGWTRFLPKPGAWMDRFRKIMGIPMLLAVIWLAWVLSKEVDTAGMLLIFGGTVTTAMFLWLLGREQWGRGRSRGLMGVTLIITAGVIAAIGTGLFDRDGSVAAKGDWNAWSEDAVRVALAEGNPVFVDFTAAWCVTCQVNKLTAINADDVQAALREQGYVLLVGDWTNRDPAITKVLAHYGRSGVPLYLIYRSDGTAEVLPELLTADTLLDAINNPAGR